MVAVLIRKESRYPVPREIVRQAVEEIIGEQKLRGKVEVSVAIIGDRKMRELKKNYLQEEGTCEVLSFPADQTLAKFIDPPDGVLRLGDVVISYPQVLKKAAEDNILVDETIKNLVKHGVRHLLGINQE